MQQQMTDTTQEETTIDRIHIEKESTCKEKTNTKAKEQDTKI